MMGEAASSRLLSWYQNPVRTSRKVLVVLLVRT